MGTLTATLSAANAVSGAFSITKENRSINWTVVKQGAYTGTIALEKSDP